MRNVGTQSAFFPLNRTQESLQVKDSRRQLHEVELTNHATTEPLHDYGQQTIQRPMTILLNHTMLN